MLPRIYPIVDASNFDTQHDLLAFARQLALGGATLIQYRNKKRSARQMLSDTRNLRLASEEKVRWIMNDRADLCLAAGFDGVHLGQDDLSPEGARKLVKEGKWIGVSSHSVQQAIAADATTADYIAVGPIFATSSKERSDPAVGLEGLNKVRAATRKPLVAIGGITLANCRSVIDAGADSVAVISALLASPAKTVEDFIRVLM
ncbi:MAG: thiamine phosphate synthase [Terriglobales bacterium]|jgi:thiamine-phosphate pyrophosphorylase